MPFSSVRLTKVFKCDRAMGKMWGIQLAYLLGGEVNGCKSDWNLI